MVRKEELEFINKASIISQEMVSNRMPLSDLWYKITGQDAGAVKRRGEIDKILLRIINERRTSEVDSDDLLDLLLNTRYEDGQAMPDRQIMDEAKIFYAAGHETSALALTWTFYLLAKHPEIDERLHQFLKSGFGEDTPSFERLHELSFPQHILEESMRLYPPAWILGRRSIEEDEFEDVKIPAERDVLFITYSIHRNPKYWEDPDSFQPDRFNAENKKEHKDSAYVPFGLGPRLCIGKGFAMMEMEFVLAMISSRYRFELVDDKEIELEPLVTLKPKNGVKARVVKR
jgi:cytochrome P450